MSINRKFCMYTSETAVTAYYKKSYAFPHTATAK